MAKCIALAMRINNFACSQYGNFPFNSMGKVGSSYYGACSTGIYKLETGNKDNLSNIHAVFKLPFSDWGVSNVKRIRKVYLGYETDGEITLVVSNDEDNAREYSVPYNLYDRENGTVVNVGRNGIGRYWSIKVENEDGAFFAIDSIEALPIILNSRKSSLA